MSKKLVFRILFSVQLLAFALWYGWGENGVASLHRSQRHNDVLRERIDGLEQEIDDLSKRICAVKTDDFYKESIARLQLQMARAGETIYILD